MRFTARGLIQAGFLTTAMTVAAIVLAPHSRAVALPDPANDTPLASDHGTETAVFAGGCFWGMQGVFEHVKGVTHVTAGYAGGSADTAQYETVSTGTTGHAESVQVTWDPAQVTFGQLLKVYFGVAHDPTQLNRQDPDEGTQYRSAIFFTAPEQQKVAQGYVTQLDAAKAFPQPIVTQIVPFKGFYAAEGYHQDYLQHHPNQPYIAMYDMPKIAALKRELPNLYADAVTN
jgi:peptide-methionine (S)-S-oxide reductase